MLKRLYHKWIGQFVIRKLNLGIGLSLLIVFLLIGFFTHHSYYNMLEEREVALLNARTLKLHDELNHIISQFKQEVMTFYHSSEGVPATYRYFLPKSVPGDNQQKLMAEQHYFSGLLSRMLERNPRILSVLVYRLSDDKLYTKSRYQIAAMNEFFLINEFFPAIPKNFDYPYIGESDRLFTNLDLSVIYIVSPVFDFNNMHYKNIQGYFMVVIDSRTLVNLFQTEKESNNRLIIKQDEKHLFDSHEDLPAFPLNEVLINNVVMKDYNLNIVGMTHKSSIQSKLSEITTLLFSGLALAWFICMRIIQYILSFVSRRLKLMTEHFKEVQTNPFVKPMKIMGTDEIGELIKNLNQMTKKLQEHINHVYITKVQKSKAEYTALKMQINPHFLYNTLESLRMQAVINRQHLLAEKLFYLGKLYRWILKTDREEIPIQEELEYIRYYLDLYMMGKSKQITLETDMEATLNELFILKFSLQPIIENAILHGKLEEQAEPIIKIQVKLTQNNKTITIWNNGKSITKKKRLLLNDMLQEQDVFKKEHLGLKNVHERIRAYYGESYGLTIPPQNTDDGFKICMILPKQGKETKEHSCNEEN